MTYQVDYTEDAINDLRKISKSDRSMIKKAIEERSHQRSDRIWQTSPT